MGFEIRPDIAAALSEVEGVAGHERRPSNPRAGDGWPMKPSGEAMAPGTFVTLWRVAVLISNDEKAGEEWIASHLGLLCDALQPHVWVEGWETDVIDNTPALILLCRE